MNAIIYEISTGFITKCVEANTDTIDVNVGPGEAYIEGFINDHSIYRVANGEVLEKPPLVVNVVGNSITGIPPGTVASTLTSEPFVIEDGLLEVSAQYPQTVVVNLSNPAFQPVTVEVSV